MEKIKVISLVKTNIWLKSAVFVIFLAISMLSPFLKQQFITGPIVNAVLFLTTAFLGISAGVLIGFLPSLVSAFVGLLPLPLLPMIPYIIMGNAVLVLIFGVLKKKSFGLGVILAGFVKFLLLYSVSSLFLSLPKPIIAMMAWPQLITALMGGIIAYFLLKFLKYEKKNLS